MILTVNALTLAVLDLAQARLLLALRDGIEALSHLILRLGQRGGVDAEEAAVFGKRPQAAEKGIT